jgi:hypothetical protein
MVLGPHGLFVKAVLLAHYSSWTKCTCTKECPGILHACSMLATPLRHLFLRDSILGGIHSESDTSPVHTKKHTAVLVLHVLVSFVQLNRVTS